MCNVSGMDTASGEGSQGADAERALRIGWVAETIVRREKNKKKIGRKQR